MDTRRTEATGGGTLAPAVQQAPAVYVVILNWNGWRLSVECLESALRLDYPNYHVVLVDNGSTDGSLDHIRAWARGECVVEPESDRDQLRRLSLPAVPKPVSLEERTSRALREGRPGDAGSGRRIVLIDAGANLGFAGGNNVGIRFALMQPDCAFIWLLNNDTVVPPDALAWLVSKAMREPEIGICGSKLVYYGRPEVIQAMGGGVYNKWLGTIRLAGANREAACSEEGMRISFVTAASALVTRRFVEEVGPLCEDYFLYFEELDWAARCGNAFRLAYEPKSVVYHKRGASIGSDSSFRRRSAQAEYYGARSRLMFTRKFFPYALPMILLVILLVLLKRLAFLQFDHAGAIASALLGRSPGPSK